MTNPFSTKFWASGAIPFLFSEPGERLDTLLEKAGRHPICQIVGPHGSGKSTLLLELRKGYEKEGEEVRYLFFNNNQQQQAQQQPPVSDWQNPGDALFRATPFRATQTLLVDGFEQLSLFNRFRLLFQAKRLTKRLILTVHRPVWFIPILYRTEPQFSTFVQVVRQIVPNPPEESILRTVYDHSGGNFRDAFFELYDMFAV